MAKRKVVGSYKRKIRKKDGKIHTVTIRQFAKTGSKKRKYTKPGPKTGARKLGALIERLQELKAERESLRKKIDRELSVL